MLSTCSLIPSLPPNQSRHNQLSEQPSKVKVATLIFISDSMILCPYFSFLIELNSPLNLSSWPFIRVLAICVWSRSLGPHSWLQFATMTRAAALPRIFFLINIWVTKTVRYDLAASWWVRWKIFWLAIIGHFVWNGINFSKSARNIAFSAQGPDHRPILCSELLNSSGIFIPCEIDLSAHIANIDGELVFDELEARSEWRTEIHGAA